MQSTVRLKQGMAFETEAGGHTFMIDAHAGVGGKDLGPPPKVLMLSALAGCGAMDIISILRKMRAEPVSLEVTADADTSSTHPKVFENMTVKVVVTGQISPVKLWKAVKLSRDRYCGVAEMLRAHGPVTYTVILDGKVIEEI